MTTISDKLRLIMEGNLLLEAEEDKYDLGGNTDNDKNTTTDTDPPTEDTGTAPDAGDQNVDGATDAGDGGGNYDLGDGGDDPATSDNTNTDGDSTDPVSTDTQPAVGEILNIDPKTRAILTFKNFERYRDLRDDTSRLITELSEFIPTTDEVRNATNTTIEKSTDLLNKLNDYILYKYSGTSYELNYYNFMQFILEKRYLNELYENIIKPSSQAKGNK